MAEEAENQALLESDLVYKGEKEPESKDAAEVGENQVVNGVPLGSGNVVGAPASRTPWATGLCCCLGSGDPNDLFCGTDVEVCALGAVAPCLLHAGNVERMEPYPNTYVNNCLPYSVMLFLGNFLFNTNCLAPLFSFPTRTAIRRRFNLQGNCESITNSLGCCGEKMESDESREQCESFCDFAVHFCCHPCALCQEAREVRRRLPHPAHSSRPYFPMVPPSEQLMGT